MMSFIRKLGWLVHRRSREEQLAAEMQFHLDEEAEERREAGVPEEEARWAARRELGNLGAVMEETRAAWGWTLLEQLLQDLRYGCRAILRNPAFATLVLLSLALGIGANTSIYSFLDALLMRSLPVADPQSLVVFKWHLTGKRAAGDSVVHDVSGHIDDDPKAGKTAAIFPYPAFELLRKSSDWFAALFAYRPARKLNVSVQGQAEIAGGEYVSGEYFQGLEVAPAAGRLIIPDDDRAGAPPVVVLSYAFAQARYGDAAGAVGRTVLVNRTPFTAVGVAPPDFFGVDPAAAPQFYLPMHADLLLNPERAPQSGPVNRYFDEHYYWIEMMGRMRPGVTLAQAQPALAGLFGRWVAGTAANAGERGHLPELWLQSGAGGLDSLRRTYSKPVYLLLGMVVLILGIACANIANLLLARAAARRREMAVRLSMGAGRSRVIRQLLTESLLLAAIGGIAGVLLSVWGVRALKLLLATASGAAFPIAVALNWRVLAAAAALTMLTGLLFGLAPALQATRVDVAAALKGSRTGERRPRLVGFSLNSILVVSQIAVSVLLLAAAGLFARTLSNLRSLDMGFNRNSLLVFKLNAGQAGYRAPEIVAFYRDLEKRFAALPGVRGAGAANSALIGDGAWGWPVVPAGRPRPENAPSGHGSGMVDTASRVLATGPGFFSTMQIPLLAGRQFDERDGPGAPLVAIVNEAWLKVNGKGRNPIGQHLVSFPPRSDPQDMEIIGVARNARYEELTGRFPPIVYMSFQQDPKLPIDEMTFFVRTEGPPLAYMSSVREIVHQADPRIPVTNVATQAARIDREMSLQILFARLCTGFALLALTIACVGLYGMMSHAVARRTPEIGIRIALGARRGTLLWMVQRDVLKLAAVGLAIGVPLALALTNVVRSVLFGVETNDPPTIAAVVAILLGAAVLSGYVPARRASRIDPMIAVRHE